MFNDGDKDTRERASTDCLFSRGTPLHWDTCAVQQRASLDNGDFVMGDFRFVGEECDFATDSSSLSTSV